MPADNLGEPITATIKNGKYEVATTAGKKIVQITAPKVTRNFQVNPNAPVIPVTEESLPDRYHAQSELQFEAQPGANTKDWTLERKKT